MKKVFILDLTSAHWFCISKCFLQLIFSPWLDQDLGSFPAVAQLTDEQRVYKIVTRVAELQEKKKKKKYSWDA